MFVHVPLVAFFEPAIVGLMIPLTLCMIPIVAILTSHQRRMAEIVRGPQGSVDPRLAHELEFMRRELSELKILMHQQAIAIDNLAPRLSPPAEVARRLESIER